MVHVNKYFFIADAAGSINITTLERTLAHEPIHNARILFFPTRGVGRFVLFEDRGADALVSERHIEITLQQFIVAGHKSGVVWNDRSKRSQEFRTQIKRHDSWLPRHLGHIGVDSWKVQIANQS